jgi:hypothetical protein
MGHASFRRGVCHHSREATTRVVRNHDSRESGGWPEASEANARLCGFGEKKAG